MKSKCYTSSTNTKKTKTSLNCESEHLATHSGRRYPTCWRGTKRERRWRQAKRHARLRLNSIERKAAVHSVWKSRSCRTKPPPRILLQTLPKRNWTKPSACLKSRNPSKMRMLTNNPLSECWNNTWSTTSSWTVAKIWVSRTRSTPLWADRGDSIWIFLNWSRWLSRTLPFGNSASYSRNKSTKKMLITIRWLRKELLRKTRPSKKQGIIRLTKSTPCCI